MSNPSNLTPSNLELLQIISSQNMPHHIVEGVLGKMRDSYSAGATDNDETLNALIALQPEYNTITYGVVEYAIRNRTQPVGFDVLENLAKAATETRSSSSHLCALSAIKCALDKNSALTQQEVPEIPQGTLEKTQFAADIVRAVFDGRKFAHIWVPHGENDSLVDSTIKLLGRILTMYPEMAKPELYAVVDEACEHSGGGCSLDQARSNICILLQRSGAGDRHAANRPDPHDLKKLKAFVAAPVPAPAG